MINKHFMFTLLLVLVLATFTSTMALAQYEDNHNDEDYSTTPLIQPTMEDFAPSPEPLVDKDGNPVAEGPIGVNGYFEMSEQLKIFSLTPSYRFSEKFQMKARLPFVRRTRTYYAGEETSSGIGDIGLEGEYTHKFDGPSKLLHLQGTIKLPTGDNENVVGDDDVKVPLGTGSLDLMARAQYTQSTKTYGILGSALFRINASGESVFQTIDAGGNVLQTETVNRSNGNEFVISAFGRHVVGDGIWLNLGASLMMTGNGEEDREFNGGIPSTSELLQKSTLLDLYPGVSYRFGPITPYLGARIPVSTSYDDEFRLEERDTVFIFQLTYRPFAMVN